MNKKQLIVAWVIVGFLCIEWICVFLFYKEILYRLGGFTLTRSYNFQGVNLLIFFSFPILIIGSLLIYTLRDKKK